MNRLTPKLLAVVLAMEAFVVFFAAITAFGLQRLEPAVALGGGAGLIVLFVVAAGGVRRPWGVWLGHVLQLALLAIGFVMWPMFIVAAGLIALWVWCLWRGAKADRAVTGGGGG